MWSLACGIWELLCQSLAWSLTGKTFIGIYSTAEIGFNVLLLQEVNEHWAETARKVLSRSGHWNLAHNDKKAILAKDSG